MTEPVRATFLPEVAAEQKWDKKTTMMHLLRKGGFGERFSESILEQIKLQRYQSGKAQLSYAQYLQFKERFRN